jgi:dTDP-glucose pyrophosphorylase
MILEHFLSHPGASMRQAMALVDRNQRGIVLVVGQDRKLLGTITDGDVRRALLAGRSLETPLADLLAEKRSPAICARAGTDAGVLLELMQANRVRQVPLLDGDDRVVSLATLDDLLPDRVLPLQAVIMAGGEGTRLRPLTEETPKPMLPLGDRPLVEHLVNQLRDSGIQQISMATRHRSHVIRDHFGDGSRFGVHVSYVEEDQPLGTAGALGLLGPGSGPLLVVNGDIVTRIDFRAMLAYHLENRAEMSVAVRAFDLQLPYGVVESNAARVTGIREKPLLRFQVNAGIYLLEPTVVADVPTGQRFDMTDLLAKLIAEQRMVVSFPVIEYWLDIGRPEDYERARRDAAEGR